MEDLKKFFIDGKWIIPNSTNIFPVIDPSNEKIFAEIILGNDKDVEAAVYAAKKAFNIFSSFSKDDRLKLLENLLSVMEKRFEDLAKSMTKEMGAPIKFSRNSQADSGIGHLKGFIESLKKQSEREVISNGDILVREPIGVCALITPWNWPINQITLKVIPALAVGCTCILKPSEHTPLSAKIFSEIIEEAGYPPGVFNLINGDGPTVGTLLSKHKDVDMVSFTGSTRAGVLVSKNAADSVKRVTLELGGKSPNLVFSDCNLEERVKESVLECFSNSGQSCDAPTRLIVERKCYNEVLKIAENAAKNQKVDDPHKDGDHIGPLFDQIQFDRVQNMIQLGINEGAKLLIGGLGKPDGFDKGWYVKPTIFYDVHNKMQIAREEIFGPVLVIIPFEDEKEAIEIANDTPYGLASYLQTGDTERAERVASKLRAGSVHINGGSLNYGSPFGGYKQSGNGREGGDLGLEDFQEFKTLHF